MKKLLNIVLFIVFVICGFGCVETIPAPVDRTPRYSSTKFKPVPMRSQVFPLCKEKKTVSSKPEGIPYKLVCGTGTEKKKITKYFYTCTCADEDTVRLKVVDHRKRQVEHICVLDMPELDGLTAYQCP